MSIRPEFLTLDKLLQNRLFRIPEYQRAYSWTKRQRDDLFEDLLKLADQGKDRHHFMSTIVCLQTDENEEIGTDEYRYLYVVDGQQRLTTLVILLKAISTALAKGDEEQQGESKRLENLLVKNSGQLILLQTNHDSSSVFRKYMLYGAKAKAQIALSAAEENLDNAFGECEQFVAEWVQDDRDLLVLVKMIKNRLDFVFHVLTDESAVYRVFEVLNSRGLPVDPLDKYKSMQMGMAYELFEDRANAAEQIAELHKCWGKIYRVIGTRDIGEEILRFATTLDLNSRPSSVVSAEDALRYAHEYWQNEPSCILDDAGLILVVAEELVSLLNDPRIRVLTRISQARLLALAFRLMLRFNDDADASMPKFRRVMAQWERTTFRIYGLHRKDSRSRVGDYVRLAWDCLNSIESADEIVKELQRIGVDFPIEQGLAQLRDADCYNDWDDELRHFMYRYEQHLAEQAGATISDETWLQIWQVSAAKSIEHILPQTFTPNWAKGFANERRAERWVNRLGNLVLLPPGINSQAGNKAFAEKRVLYDKYQLRMLEEIVALQQWNRQAIIDREERLLKWAKGAWSDV